MTTSSNNIYILVSDRRLWILNYNTFCAIVFIPPTIYAAYKFRKRRLTRKKKLECEKREYKIFCLQTLHKILKLSNSPFASIVLMDLILLRGGEDVVIPGVDDCIDIEQPSYIDNERILRFLNDKFANFNINGIIYITKEALCYLVEGEGLVDFPIIFLERIKIDGVYSFLKVASKWAVLSFSALAAASELLTPTVAAVLALSGWLWIHYIKILQPSVREVEKLTGKYVPRISDRKDAIVFDAKKEPLPPAMEKSIKKVKIKTLDTEYEITEKNLVDISKVSRLKNRFSDRLFNRLNRPKRKKFGKIVKFTEKVKEWANIEEIKETLDNMQDDIFA